MTQLLKYTQSSSLGELIVYLTENRYEGMGQLNGEFVGKCLIHEDYISFCEGGQIFFFNKFVVINEIFATEIEYFEFEGSLEICQK